MGLSFATYLAPVALSAAMGVVTSPTAPHSSSPRRVDFNYDVRDVVKVAQTARVPDQPNVCSVLSAVIFAPFRQPQFVFVAFKVAHDGRLARLEEPLSESEKDALQTLTSQNPTQHDIALASHGIVKLRCVTETKESAAPGLML